MREVMPEASSSLFAGSRRQWLVALLPFVGAAWLPWWALLGYSLTLWVARAGRPPEALRVALLMCVSGLSLFPLAQKLDFGSVDAIGVFALRALALLALPPLLHLAAVHLEDGNSKGGWLLLPLLLLPFFNVLPVTTLGLAGGTLLGLAALLMSLLGTVQRRERTVRLLGQPRRALGLTLAVGLGLAGLAGAVLLPWNTPERSLVERLGDTVRPPTAEKPQPAAKGQRDKNSSTGLAGHANPIEQARANGEVKDGKDDFHRIVASMEIAIIAALALGVLGKRFQAIPRQGKPRWWELSLLLSFIFIFGWLLYIGIALYATSTSGGLGPTGNTLGDTSELQKAIPGFFRLKQNNTLLMNILTNIWIIGGLLLAMVLFYAGWLLRSMQWDEGTTKSRTEKSMPSSVGPQAPLHRVRLAYRAALEALEERGLGRFPAETPAEFAHRIPQFLPAAALPLGSLTAAYAPVRYGGRVSEAEAEQAEADAAQICQLAAAYTAEDKPS